MLLESQCARRVQVRGQTGLRPSWEQNWRDRSGADGEARNQDRDNWRESEGRRQRQGKAQRGVRQEAPGSRLGRARLLGLQSTQGSQLSIGKGWPEASVISAASTRAQVQAAQ